MALTEPQWHSRALESTLSTQSAVVDAGTPSSELTADHLPKHAETLSRTPIPTGNRQALRSYWTRGDERLYVAHIATESTVD